MTRPAGREENEFMNYTIIYYTTIDLGPQISSKPPLPPITDIKSSSSDIVTDVTIINHIFTIYYNIQNTSNKIIISTVH